MPVFKSYPGVVFCQPRFQHLFIQPTCSLKSVLKPPLLSEPQEIRNIHNDELMGIRREEEMEMSDEEIEDPSEMKETEESGKIPFYSS